MAEFFVARVLLLSCAMNQATSRGLLYFMAAATVVAASACGGAEPDDDGCAEGEECPGMDVDGFELVTCKEEGRADLLSGLALSRDVDYLGLYEAGLHLDGAVLVQELGEACASASDVSACEAAMEEISSDVTFQLGQCVQICPEHILVTRSGDQVDIVVDDAGLAELLGEIDAPADAVVRAMNQGYSVRCEDQARGGVVEVDGGYEVLATKMTASCDPVEITRYRLMVGRDGSVTILDSEVLEREYGICA